MMRHDDHYDAFIGLRKKPDTTENEWQYIDGSPLEVN